MTVAAEIDRVCAVCGLDTERAAAIHEAGHAVVGHALGWRVENMRLSAHEHGIAGSARVLPPLGAVTSHRLMLERAIGDAAGVAAEVIDRDLSTEAAVELRSTHGAGDMRNATYFLSLVYDRAQVAALIDYAHLRAGRILEKKWLEVLQLADAVIDAGEVVFADAEHATAASLAARGAHALAVQGVTRRQPGDVLR